MKKLLAILGILVLCLNPGLYAKSAVERVGGGNVAYDLGDNGNDSEALTELAIINDTDGIWTEPSADKALFDGTSLLYESELNTFAELQVLIADKTLVNEEDAVTWDANHIFASSNGTAITIDDTVGGIPSDIRFIAGVGNNNITRIGRAVSGHTDTYNRCAFDIKDENGTVVHRLATSVGCGLHTVFNDNGSALEDFIVETDTNTTAFYIDSGAETITTNVPLITDSIFDIGTVETFAALDATPDVSTGSYFNTNTSAVTITDFDGLGIRDGQIIIVTSKGAITYDCTAAGFVCGTTDIVTASGDVTTWKYDGTDWALLSFIDQSDDIGAGGSGEWTDTGSILHPNEETVDEIAIGGTTEAGADIFLGVDGAAVFNEQGGAVNFRIESDTEVNMFVVDGTNDTVGIGTGTPSTVTNVMMEVEKFGTEMTEGALLVDANLTGTQSGDFRGYKIDLNVGNTTSSANNVYGMWTGLRGTATGGNTGEIAAWSLDSRPAPTSPTTYSNVHLLEMLHFGNVNTTITTLKGIEVDLSAGGSGTTSYGLHIKNNSGFSTEYAIVTDDGTTVLNENGEAYDFRVESATNPNALFLDGSADSWNIDAKTVDTADARTIADTGDANPATLTLEPLSGYVPITCNDANTCDITMSETNAIDGQKVEIVNLTANVVDMADTAGVSELAGAFAMGQYDSIKLRYSTDRWVETTRSDN